MAWQKYPLSLRAWKKWMQTREGTTLRVGRDFKGPMPMTPELIDVCCDHRWPREGVYAIRNGWLEGVWNCRLPQLPSRPLHQQGAGRAGDGRLRRG